MNEALMNAIEEREELLAELSRKVWEFAEVGLQEHRSAEALADALEEEGFEVERGVAGMPTAFYATYSVGTGKPVIGVLGEYDALPGLSQEVTPERKPREPGAPGHACGHNLLGVAGVGTAMAAKQVMDEQGIDGTIRYYGCPAEETLVGKVYMVREGLFDDVDAALTWHPGQVNVVRVGSSNALNSAKFQFFGRSSHAAGNPEAGRSALDAVELMNVGANFLREHVPEKTRIHYVTTNGGGEPNVVPDEAEVWYYVRGPKRQDVDEVYERLQKIAEGATLMTETTMEETFLTGCYNYLHNHTIGECLQEKMEELGAPEFTEAEKELARKVQETFPERQIERVAERYDKPELAEQVLHEDVEPLSEVERHGAGSTDVGDVSWVVPLAQFSTACSTIGTAGHSWQYTIASGSTIGERGMLFASKIMAATAMELLTDAEFLQKAKEEFEEVTADEPYESPLPADLDPPLDQLPEH
jgi:aminobenzoyl-glutamate utilization protein B